MKIKRVSKIICFMLMLLVFVKSSIYAASLTGNSNVYVGDTFTLTFDFGENVGAYNSINVTYDSSAFEYVSGDSLSESVWWDQTEASNGISTKTYTFKAKKASSSRITVVASDVTSANNDMTDLGTLTAEKLVNVAERVQEEVPPPTTTENTQGNVNPSSSKASGNNYLKYLQISEEGLTPDFSRYVTDYAITVEETVDSIEILAKAEDSKARVEISGNTNLKSGDNVIDIKVTAENGYYRVYNIMVTKSADKSKANAYLGSLVVEDYKLNKKFQSETLEYDLGELLSTVKSLNIVASAKDKDAKIEIKGADQLVESGNGKITITVTAPDGTTTKVYKINYTIKEATAEEVAEVEMKDYLRDIQNSKGKKELAISYLKYIWSAIKKNYLLVTMYVVVLVEFITILVLMKKLRKAKENNNGGGDDSHEKEILKVEKEQVEEPVNEPTIQENITIEPPKVKLLDEIEEKSEEIPRLGRTGSLEKNSYKAEESTGIKLVDLDKNEGPKDELTFNIFENLNDDDIKRMLEDQIDDN